MKREKLALISILLCLCVLSCGPSKETVSREVLLPSEVASAYEHKEREEIDEPKEGNKGRGQDDYQVLDERVRKMARALGKKPEKYRLLIRTDSDGAKIYRQLGGYVVLYPDQEMMYIPDQI